MCHPKDVIEWLPLAVVPPLAGAFWLWPFGQGFRCFGVPDGQKLRGVCVCVEQAFRVGGLAVSVHVPNPRR
jgi:hypothetical protein